MGSPQVAGGPTELAHERVVLSAPGVLSADLGDQVALLAPGTGIYYGLDEVGRRVWQLVEEAPSLGAIRDRVLAEYEVEPARLDQDLSELIGELSAEGLIVLIDRAER